MSISESHCCIYSTLASILRSPHLPTAESAKPLTTPSTKRRSSGKFAMVTQMWPTAFCHRACPVTTQRSRAITTIQPVPKSFLPKRAIRAAKGSPSSTSGTAPKRRPDRVKWKLIGMTWQPLESKSIFAKPKIGPPSKSYSMQAHQLCSVWLGIPTYRILTTSFSLFSILRAASIEPFIAMPKSTR